MVTCTGKSRCTPPPPSPLIIIILIRKYCKIILHFISHKDKILWRTLPNRETDHQPSSSSWERHKICINASLQKISSRGKKVWTIDFVHRESIQAVKESINCPAIVKKKCRWKEEQEQQQLAILPQHKCFSPNGNVIFASYKANCSPSPRSDTMMHA